MRIVLTSKGFESKYIDKAVRVLGCEARKQCASCANTCLLKDKPLKIYAKHTYVDLDGKRLGAFHGDIVSLDNYERIERMTCS